MDGYAIDGVSNALRANTGVGVEIDDGSDLLLLMFSEGGPELGKIVYFPTKPDLDEALFLVRAGREEVAGTYAPLDWTQKHTYRVERTIGGNLRLFVDEAAEPIIDMAQEEFPYLTTLGSRAFRFGSLLDDRTTESAWEFFHYAPSTGLDLMIDQVLDEDDKFDKTVNVIASVEDTGP